MDDGRSWRHRLWRWRWCLAAIVLIVGVRLALPAVLRSVIVSQASQNLRAEVELGDVDLSLWRGGVVLEDFALRPPALAATGEPPVTPVPGAAIPEPLVAWKRLALGVRFLPLFHQTVQLYELAIDAPQVALDRLESGELNLVALLPPSATEPDAGASPSPTPAVAEAASGWRFGIDKIAFGEGRLVFRDRMVAGSEPVELGIPSIEISDVALDPRVYGGPLSSRVKILLDDGTLELGAEVRLTDAGTGIDADLQATNLPLRRSRLYVPDVGWSDLRGALDASLHYQLDPGAKSEVRGSVTLRDVEVTVPELPDVALGWKSLTVRVDPLDLFARSVHVAEIDLTGAVLTVEPQGGDRLPVLARRTAAAAAADPGAEEKQPQAEEAPAWRWSLASLRLSDTRVHLLATPAPLDVALSLTLQNLADRGGGPAGLDLRAEVGSGSLALHGEPRVEPPGFSGTLTARDLSLPELIAASGVKMENPLRAARLDCDLEIGAGMPLAGGKAIGAGDLAVKGKLSVAEARVAPPGFENFEVGARAVGIVLSRLDLPGILAAAAAAEPMAVDLGLAGELSIDEPRLALAKGEEFLLAAKGLRLALSELELPVVAAAAAPPRPIVVSLRELRLEAPDVRITRKADGLVLPASSTVAAAPTASGSGEAVSGTSPATPAQKAGAAPVEVSLGSLVVHGGRVAVIDRAVQPSCRSDLSSLEIEARDVRWPDLAARHIHLSTRTAGSGEIEIMGELSSAGGTIQIDGRNVDLASFNPYATTYSPFMISGGAASLSTKVSFKRGSYDLSNSLTLHRLDLSGKQGESLFEKEFGVPLSTALALMRDGQGDIAVDIPVKVDQQGTQIDIWSIAGGALRRALVNALTSPLRLLGAVVPSGDKVESVAPAAIRFPRGRADAGPEAQERLRQLGAFLATRPTLAIELETAPTQTDGRWLREQALRQSWQEQGLVASLLSLVEGDSRTRVQAALAARAEGEAGKLSSEDERRLDEWLEKAPPLPPAQVAALAAERLARAQAVITANGVDPARVTAIPPAPEAGDGEPEVRVRLKPV